MQRSIAIAELTNNLKPIVYEYNRFSGVVGNNVRHCVTGRADAETDGEAGGKASSAD